jgi:DNA polymerase III beta subunit, central domain
MPTLTTAPAPDATAHSVDIPAADLSAVLAAVIPHAGKDSTLPTLCGLQLTVADGQIKAEATDRYSYASAWTEATGPDGTAWSVVVEATAAADMVRMAKPWVRQNVSVQLTPGHGKLMVRTALAEQTFLTMPVEFPDVDKLLAADTADSPDGWTVGLASRNVQKFCKSAAALDATWPMRFELGARPSAAIQVRIGDTFHGLLMPIRLPDQG